MKLTVAAVVEDVNELRWCVIPLLASPQGGVAASSRKCCEATEADAAGVVFLLFSIGKPPRPRDQRRLRDIFLIARPPLLLLGLRAAALALRGGDARRGIRSIPILHTLMSAATKIALRNFIILRRPALPGSLLRRCPVFLAAGNDLLLE